MNEWIMTLFIVVIVMNVNCEQIDAYSNRFGISATSHSKQTHFDEKLSTILFSFQFDKLNHAIGHTRKIKVKLASIEEPAVKYAYDTYIILLAVMSGTIYTI